MSQIGIIVDLSPLEMKQRSEQEQTNEQETKKEQNNEQETEQNCQRSCLNHFSPKMVVKSVIYRLFATAGTITTTYIVTHDTSQSFKVGIINSAVATILYYVYDKIWERYCKK